MDEKYKFNIEDQRDVIKLKNSKRFPKYPNEILSNICEVKVNGDEYLKEDEFLIKSKYNILPKKIFIYGKKSTRNSQSNDNLYTNYWLEIFLKTIEKGLLCKYDLNKNNSASTLEIGLTFDFRRYAFNHIVWTRDKIIKYLSCLFGNTLEEADFKQEDFIENILVA